MIIKIAVDNQRKNRRWKDPTEKNVLIISTKYV